MLGRLIPVIIALVLGTAAIASSAGGSHDLSPAAQRLPDLDQEVPWNLQVTRDQARGGYRLGFSSAVRNVGAGPLIVTGRRRAATPTMTVDQLIEQEDAPVAVVEGVGRMRYVRSPDHEHWHLLGFERYELRRATGRAQLVTDRKTGFFSAIATELWAMGKKAQPPEPSYTGAAALNAPLYWVSPRESRSATGTCTTRTLRASPCV